MTDATKPSVSERLRAMSANTMPYHKTERDCHENECRYEDDCAEWREVSEIAGALATEIEEIAALVRAGFWGTDERIAVADRLSPRKEGT